MLLKARAQNPGSGLHRPINAEHLLYRGSMLKNFRAILCNLIKEESCFLLAPVALSAGVSMQWLSLIRPN